MSFREAEERYEQRLFALYNHEPATAEPATLLHVVFSDGSEDYYDSDCDKAMGLLHDHIRQATFEGQTYTVTKINQD